MITDHEVLIVGAGPTGLAGALALADAGIDAVVLERSPQIVDHPRGHVINTRTMEIFRQWGVAEAVRAKSIDASVARRISWATALDEPEISSMLIPREPPGVSPVHSVSCAQDRLEAVLLDEAVRRGATVRYGSEVVDLAHTDENTVRVTTADGCRMEAAHLIGADGAASTIRKLIGVQLEGPGNLGAQINIAFEADLDGYLGPRRSLLTWIIHERHPGVLIDMGENRWVFNLGYDDRKVDRSTFDRTTCMAILDDLVPAEAGAAIHSIHPWRLASQLAENYRVGNVFLCGDAAHQFPPTGGLGANTGIADAHNLAWKLARHLRDQLPAEALDTYEAERRPVAEANSRLSLQNAHDITRTGVGPGSIIAARTLAAGGAEADAEIARIRAAIPDQREHFSHLGQDLGYRYDTNVLIAEMHGDEPIFDIENYTAHIRPGHRFPHAWVRDGVSTLDLIGPDHVLFGSEQGRWADAIGGDARVRWTPLPATVADTVGCGDGSAVLVRPDGHIAATFPNPTKAAEHEIENLSTGRAGGST